jgi:hypothetical protein
LLVPSGPRLWHAVRIVCKPDPARQDGARAKGQVNALEAKAHTSVELVARIPSDNGDIIVSVDFSDHAKASLSLELRR